MSSCDYCEEEFSDKESKLDHELIEHEDEMSGHEQSEKKSKQARTREES